MINWAVGIIAAIVSFMLFKRGGKPAVSWFILATAGIWIGFGAKLLQTATAWQVGAGILWFVVLLAVLKLARQNGKYVIPFMLIALIAIGGVAYAAPKNAADANQPEAQAKTETGQSTWKMGPSDYTNNRWFADGINEIQTASTHEDAVKATTAWLDRVKTDPNLLAGAAKFFLKKDIDKATLVDSNGYATDTAIQLTTELGLAIATAQNITPSEAPSTGINSGVVNNSVVQSASAGIDGDRKAIQIDLQNGETIWVMGRCGNPVTAGSIGLPTGTTDNPAPPSTPTNPPTPDNPLEPKDASQDIGVNPAVAPWKQDDIASGNESGHTVSNEDGATVSNGYQANPAADAAVAADNAASAAAEQTAAHDAAVSDAVNSGGGVVDNNQSHTVSTPAASDPNW